MLFIIIIFALIAVVYCGWFGVVLTALAAWLIHRLYQTANGHHKTNHTRGYSGGDADCSTTPPFFSASIYSAAVDTTTDYLVDDELLSQSESHDTALNEPLAPSFDPTLDTASSIDINPATGLPMLDGIGSVDVAGNPYGIDFNDSLTPLSQDDDLFATQPDFTHDPFEHDMSIGTGINDMEHDLQHGFDNDFNDDFNDNNLGFDEDNL